MAYKHNSPQKQKMNIVDYVTRKYMIKATPARITPEGIFRIVKGVLVPEAEFMSAHPAVELFDNEFTKEKIGCI